MMMDFVIVNRGVLLLKPYLVVIVTGRYAGEQQLCSCSGVQLALALYSLANVGCQYTFCFT